jgi:phosphatidylglycerol:prolipoprotein diacylglycerol transferase
MLPIHIDFWIISLHNYEGIYFFIAILAAIIFMTILAKEYKMNVDYMYEAVFIGLIAGLVTGRLFAFITWDLETLLTNPLTFFNPMTGGIRITGGAIGGLTAGMIYARIRKLNFWYHIKIFIPAILVGQIIGRIGCFFNGDSNGKATSMPWGLIYHPESLAYNNPVTNNPTLPLPGTPLHPAQLYEILANLLLLVFILASGKNPWITRRRLIWYIMGHSIIRFVIEFYRNDSEEIWGLFKSAHLVTGLAFLLGLGLLTWSFFFDKKMMTPEELQQA